MRWSARIDEVLTNHPDAILAVGVATVLGLLVVPVPPGVLDLLLAANIATATVVFVAVLAAERPLALSTFPTILLVTTLARLALNVSSTRLILGQGRAGEVVEAFGQFVVRGDVVMGLVVFAILVIVQLLVIGKGAERVAEVGARFTLDALPGRQMSIDAALRAGTLTDEEADAQRTELQRESEFHGAMDGAMKFVKGDALAGVVITALNLFAGLGIGVGRYGYTFVEAIERYSILTVGDGLVAQIPALLVTSSAGILTTRVASDRPRTDLSRLLGRELFGRPKTLALAAGFCGALAIVPGLPVAPFLGIGGALAWAAFRLRRAQPATPKGSARVGLERRLQAAEAPAPDLDAAPSVAALGVDLGAELAAFVGIGAARDHTSELVRELLPQLRHAIFLETGVRLPGVRVRAAPEGLPPRTLLVRVREVPVAAHEIDLEGALILAPPEQLSGAGLEARPVADPVRGGVASRVDLAQLAAAGTAGFSTWAPAGVVALHLARVAREHLPRFLGLHEVQDLLERLRGIYPALVGEVVPRLVSVALLAEVLRNLVEERVSVRDLKTILEALAEVAERESDAAALTEHVRSALGLQLLHDHVGADGRLLVVTLDEAVEVSVRASLIEVGSGVQPALSASSRAALGGAAIEALSPLRALGRPPIVLTQPDVRRHVRSLLRDRVPDLVVLSARDLPPTAIVEAVGHLGASPEAAAPRAA